MASANHRLAAFFLAIIISSLASTPGAAWDVKLEIDDGMPLIHMLRPLLSSAAGNLARRRNSNYGVPCDSWRFAVETNTIRDWATIPASCEDYVGNYMLGGHYRRDSRAVVDEAIAYAEGLELAGEGKEAHANAYMPSNAPSGPVNYYSSADADTK
ncbi:hypothetical protein HU200_019467 [Digitaria exilis]|uniref:Uncharacterized protein n=1 Tax=Digitaria exilis TaxID=1010633 RepID=A0A835F3B8_9POAL|nr:hypothetical protein HU200_019467 [Digitaria exilis]